jgi:hypothetical protein
MNQVRNFKIVLPKSLWGGLVYQFIYFHLSISGFKALTNEISIQGWGYEVA